MFDRWTNNWPNGVYSNTVDWMLYLEGTTIADYGAEVLTGDVEIDNP